MKKIAMLNCLKANEVCTGAACLKAYYEKQKAFKMYQNEEVILAAFMRCNGCGQDPEQDKGMFEKIERLQKEGVEIVHVGVCTKNREGKECLTITKIIHMIEANNMHIVRGTH